MDDWWDKNKNVFSDNGMKFNGHACIISTRGKKLPSGGHVFQDEYAHSRKTLEKLISKYRNQSPWVPTKGFVNDMVVRMHVRLVRLFGLDSKVAVRDLRLALERHGGLSKGEAEKRAEDVRSELEKCEAMQSFLI